MLPQLVILRDAKVMLAKFHLNMAGANVASFTVEGHTTATSINFEVLSAHVNSKLTI